MKRYSSSFQLGCFLEAVPTMGAIRAAAQLRPVDLSKADVMKRIFKLMDKKNRNPKSGRTEKGSRRNAGTDHKRT